MNVVTRGVHYEISDRTKARLDKKLERLSFAEKEIVDADLSITKEHREYILNMNIHLKWGARDHLHVAHEDLYDAIDLLVDKAATKVRREKEKKIDSHHA